MSRSIFQQHANAGYFRNGLAYNRAGRGPRPLIVFQGLMFENKPQAGMTFSYKFLGHEYTIYAVLRKPHLPHGYTIKNMADDYAEMIRAEFGEPVDLLGVSTGGSIAQQFAADHPELVRRLIIHSSAHALGAGGRQAQLNMAHLARQGSFTEAASHLLEFMFPKGVFWKLASWLASRLMMGNPKDLNDLIVTIEAEDQFQFKDRLGEIRAPTLVIAGSEDPFYTEDLFRETAEGIPNAHLTLYPKMRHPAYGKQFERDVLFFLKKM